MRLANRTAKLKELDHINDHCHQFIEALPFLILSAHGAKGIDCSPRGDPAGFVRLADERTIQIPDRRGNKRLDSLRNIIANPCEGIIFLVPNVGVTIRLSGQARIVVDKELNASFSINGKPSSSVLGVGAEKVYYQCPKALARSRLWETESHPERSHFTAAGEMNHVFARMHG
nr:MSMEG_1061 family FMN-dependent PPOX-type flavoprotein [Candidatus Pelagisphaera phototrophica]